MFCDILLALIFCGRYEEGCEEARYPDGTKALLLPYPDLLRGQGKIVEGMGRKQNVTKSRKTKANVDSTSLDDDHAEDEDCRADLDSYAPCKEAKSTVGDNREWEPRARVQPLADILIGPAPVRLEQVATKKKKAKFVAQMVTPGDPVKGVPKHISSPRKPVDGSGFAQQALRKTRGRQGSDRWGGMQTKKRRLMLTNSDEGLRAAEAEISTRKGNVGDQRHLVGTTRPSVALTGVMVKYNPLPYASAHTFPVRKRSAWTTSSRKQLMLPPIKNYPVRLWFQDIFQCTIF